MAPRKAGRVIEDNFRARSGNIHNFTLKLDSLVQHIASTGRVPRTAVDLAKSNIAILRGRPQTRRDLRYQEFLTDLLRICGKDIVVLCAAAFGKGSIERLSQRLRIELLDYIAANKSTFRSASLDGVAERYGVPDTICKLNIPFKRAIWKADNTK